MPGFYKWFFGLFFIALICIAPARAQKIVNVTGEAQVAWPDDKSKIDVEKEAEDLAVVNALEKAFGRAIIQGNSTFIENINTGQKTETKTGFNMIGNSYVKGEVVSVLDKNFEELEGDKVLDGKKMKFREIKCSIKIKAKEYVDPPIEFESTSLSCPDKHCNASDFKEGDSLFIYFRSAAEGYLMIYLDDAKNTEILLPYIKNRDQNDGGFPIKAKTDYVLFHRNNPFDIADELQLYTDSYTSLNRVYIIFSRTPMTIPDLKDNTGKLTENEKNQGFHLPKSISSSDFLKWITENKIRRNSFQVKTIDISIRKK